MLSSLTSASITPEGHMPFPSLTETTSPIYFCASRRYVRPVWAEASHGRRCHEVLIALVVQSTAQIIGLSTKDIGLAGMAQLHPGKCGPGVFKLTGLRYNVALPSPLRVLCACHARIGLPCLCGLR